MHDARIERLARERTEERREKLEATIAHVRSRPLPTRFATETAPAFGRFVEGLKNEGAANAARYRNGEPRSKPYDQTSIISIIAEAATFASRQAYPPELERVLHAVAAEPDAVLSTEERHLVREMQDLRRLGCRSLIEATAGAERAWQLFMEHPNSTVRLEAGESWLSLTYGPPEVAEWPVVRP